MNNAQNIQRHFQHVASKYSKVRNTDPHIIDAIILHLPSDNPPFNVVDIGCGTGRYSNLLAAQLDSNFLLYCCDYSDAMLAKCRERMEDECQLPRNIIYCRASATDLPFTEGWFDAVTTFNAIHHFDHERFITEAARILRPGGLLSIYTRTLEQNERTVWGEHFPEFTDRETRLCRDGDLEEVIDGVSELELEAVKAFKHDRAESPESLLNRARNFHYSTFALYPPDEFMRALAAFANRLNDISSNGIIEHTAENILVLARRT
jgi:ubiquinone/menaquinone biosynthesis C-methylase UbiE